MKTDEQSSCDSRPASGGVVGQTPDMHPVSESQPTGHANAIGLAIVSGVSGAIFGTLVVKWGLVAESSANLASWAGAGIGAILGWVLSRPRPHDLKWVSKHKDRLRKDRETAWMRDTRDVEGVARRQEERSRTPDMCLDDPLSKDVLLGIKRNALIRAGLITAAGIATVYMLGGGHAGLRLHWLPLGFFLFVLAAWFWFSTSSVFIVQARARRHLDGKDQQYWVKKYEHREEDDKRPDAIWYELNDFQAAKHDASAGNLLMSLHGIVFACLLYIIAFGQFLRG